MKALLFGLFFLTMSSAQAEIVRLDGFTHAGEACHLIIENWDPESNGPDWGRMGLRLRSSWQKAEHPALLVSQSFTPGALYGRNKETLDQIALNFDLGGAPSLEKIQSYNFQSAVDGLFQAFCRLRFPPKP